ncbi:hypothetical protein ABZW30_32485 [Kitasatospora sp. NPDC004669]|uniref:hypothetical protein n=1 Tax=Kitasatospora sp. NPDC004669 TaxID=3154555 RepID=UPI0033BB2372
MAATVPGPQAPARPAADRRHRLALVLGVVELVLAAPMLLHIGLIAFVFGAYGLAGAGAAGLAYAALVAGGPLLGYGLGAAIARAQGFPKSVGLAVKGLGLLVATSAEYFLWLGHLGLVKF